MYMHVLFDLEHTFNKVFPLSTSRGSKNFNSRSIHSQNRQRGMARLCALVLPLGQRGMARISILTMVLALGHYLHIDVLSHCTARHGQVVCYGVGP